MTKGLQKPYVVIELFHLIQNLISLELNLKL